MLGDVFDAVPLRAALYLCCALLILSIGLGGWVYVVSLQRDAAIANGAALEASVKMQNRSIADWKKKAAEQEAHALDAQKKAAEEQAASRRRIEKILAARVPETCPEAVQWGSIEGAKLAEEWEGKR